MQEVDINTLIDDYGDLIDDIPDNITIIGEIPILYIYHKYDKLDLSKLKCESISYYRQEDESIKNHILPNSLTELYCNNNQITLLPNLPSSLEKLDCQYNKLTHLPELPNSLTELYCNNNQLTYFPNNQLPNSLITINCSDNKLTSLPNLPNSLSELSCRDNPLTLIPNLNKIRNLGCNFLIDYIDYDPDYMEINFNFVPFFSKKLYDSYIEIKDYGRITSNEDYILYMEKVKLSKMKSARK